MDQCYFEIVKRTRDVLKLTSNLPVHHLIRTVCFFFSQIGGGSNGNAPLRLPALQAAQQTTCQAVDFRQERQVRGDVMPSRDFARLCPRASAL